eukprot:1876387-Lingulodinium_polyedra.AAC.1
MAETLWADPRLLKPPTANGGHTPQDLPSPHVKHSSAIFNAQAPSRDGRQPHGCVDHLHHTR